MGWCYFIIRSLEVEGVVLGVGVLTTVKGAGGTIGARGLVLVVVVTVTSSSSVSLFSLILLCLEVFYFYSRWV